MKFQRILIGIDDSENSKHAAEYGFELAQAFKSKVGLIHIVEPIITPQPNDPSMLGAFIPSFGVENIEVEKIQSEQSKKLLDNIAESLGKGLEVSQFNELGSKAETILQCAAQFSATLIVIGTHQRHGLDRLIMGSVSENILRHSPVPVLIIPPMAEKK
jgi:nucleotide-binding universal stress UspA family protein